jgi:hypothetical protein
LPQLPANLQSKLPTIISDPLQAAAAKTVNQVQDPHPARLQEAATDPRKPRNLPEKTQSPMSPSEPDLTTEEMTKMRMMERRIRKFWTMTRNPTAARPEREIPQLTKTMKVWKKTVNNTMLVDWPGQTETKTELPHLSETKENDHQSNNLYAIFQ